MKKKHLYALIGIIIVTIIAYNYIYKDHRDIKSEEVAFSLTSSELIEKFIIDPKLAEDLFLDKTIEVKGVVTAVGETDVVLDEKIFCAFQNTPVVKLNSLLVIKGRCIGFDDLLEEVKLDQCTMIK